MTRAFNAARVLGHTLATTKSRSSCHESETVRALGITQNHGSAILQRDDTGGETSARDLGLVAQHVGIGAVGGMCEGLAICVVVNTVTSHARLDQDWLLKSEGWLNTWVLVTVDALVGKRPLGNVEVGVLVHASLFAVQAQLVVSPGDAHFRLVETVCIIAKHGNRELEVASGVEDRVQGI